MDLPINAYEKEILDSVMKKSITIITGQTGSGKSIMVPQFLCKSGYRVFVTEPRRIATKNLALSQKELIDDEYKSYVGYSTAFEKSYSKDTKILYCTDGWQLLFELSAREEVKNKVLIIDEVHEWNINVEALIAWIKQKIVDNTLNFRVVIMSATLDEEEICKYFEGRANVIKVEGKSYTVTEEPSTYDMVTDILTLYGMGKNVLAFVAGKKEIEETIYRLKCEIKGAIILPLHSELEEEEQQKCFESYNSPKIIVSTNVAQTSITIPDIDAVVDSGKEKRIETINGIQGLYLRDVSKSDCLQRKGRAGRTKDGIYILCSKRTIERREEYRAPEIQRMALDQIILKFAANGIDVTLFNFFHKPNMEALKQAKSMLTSLGAFNCGKITDIGKKMSKIPISSRFARMIIAADELGVVDDVITIVAILEVGTLLIREECSNYSNFTDESTSDLLAELDVYNYISKLPYVDFDMMRVSRKSYFRVKEYISKLYTSLDGVVNFGSTNLRDDILLSCIYGLVDNFFEASSVTGPYRLINEKSVINLSSAKYIVGIPKNIEEYLDSSSKKQICCITMASIVSLDIMLKIAPQLFEVRKIVEENSTRSEIYYMGKLLGSDNKSCSADDKAKNKYSSKKHKRKNMYSKGIYIGSKKIPVMYSKGIESLYVNLTREELFSLNKEYLFSGKKVLLILCCDQFDYSVFNLREKINTLFIKNKFKEEERKIKLQNYSRIEDVVRLIPKLGEITLGEDYFGGRITAYVYLKQNGKNYSMALSKRSTNALKNTNEVLKNFFAKEARKKYRIGSFMEIRSGKRICSENSKRAKERFDAIVSDIVPSIDKNNFKEKIGELDIIFLSVVKEYKLNI